MSDETKETSPVNPGLALELDVMLVRPALPPRHVDHHAALDEEEELGAASRSRGP